MVDSIKGQFGFLDYEVDEGKKLFFHMSEVQGSSYSLYPGDNVEFSIIVNHVRQISCVTLLDANENSFSAHWEDVSLWCREDSRLIATSRSLNISHQDQLN